MPNIPFRVQTSPILQKVAKQLGRPRQGKVRAMWDLGDFLLMVTTFRISVFDIVLAEEIDLKADVLVAMTIFSLTSMLKGFKHHLVAFGSSIDQYLPAELRGDAILQRTAVVVRKFDVAQIEAIIRGYLTGSGWKDYVATGEVCGIKLPKGLRDGDKLPEPIFTPSTKEEEGHDVNITEEQAANLVGWDTVKLLKERSLELYRQGNAHAESVGLVLADTKTEWSRTGELVDEVLTPDSSRFWSEEARLRALVEHITPPSHDKQFVRDYADKAGIKKMTPDQVELFRLPDEVKARTTGIYVDTAGTWIRKDLPSFQAEDMGISVVA